MAKSRAVADTQLPAVKQCTDPAHHQYGSVAVRTAFANPKMAWGVMHTQNGGHYASDEDVAGWIDLQPK